jgi:hypothetical protein
MTSVTVDFFHLLEPNSNTGQGTVPAGSTVTLQGREVFFNQGLPMVFLKDVTVTASVDGTQIANANSYWSAPEPFPPGGPKALATVWTYPTGITLGAGQSMIFTTDWVLAHAVGGGPNLGPMKPPPPWGVFGSVTHAGSAINGPITCTITGT